MSEEAKQAKAENVKSVDSKQEGPDLKDEQLDEASGGGLLLPAVQKVREAAARAPDEDSPETGDVRTNT